MFVGAVDDPGSDFGSMGESPIMVGGTSGFGASGFVHDRRVEGVRKEEVTVGVVWDPCTKIRVKDLFMMFVETAIFVVSELELKVLQDYN